MKYDINFKLLKKVRERDNLCLCSFKKEEDGSNICPCVTFIETGVCKCGLYKKDDS